MVGAGLPVARCFGGHRPSRDRVGADRVVIDRTGVEVVLRGVQQALRRCPAAAPEPCRHEPSRMEVNSDDVREGQGAWGAAGLA